jgi:NAD(P)H-hydrate epimerase
MCDPSPVRIFNRAQMQEADRRTIEEHGIPATVLMERAGERVVEAMSAHFASLASLRVVVLCGRGNNGGDGFVVARFLRGRVKAPVGVYLLGRLEDVTGAAREALEKYQDGGGVVTAVPGTDAWATHRAKALDVDVIVDAIVGTGLARPLTGLPAAVVENVSRLSASVVAVDLPSGMNADTADVTPPVIRAALTVTFAAPKIPLVCMPAAEYAGTIVVGDIGIPPSVITQVSGPIVRQITADDCRELVRPRRPDAHKGSNGHVLVVAGSRGKTGAAALTAFAALRSGAGLVTVATPASCASIVASFAPELMTLPLAETADGHVAADAAEAVLAFEASVLAVGPGLGRSAQATAFVQELVRRTGRPVVLDADGLNAFEGHVERLSSQAPLIVTPHPGEMARLTGQSTAAVQADRLRVASQLSADRKLYVVLKGHGTIVAEPGGRLFVNTTGNPGMATAGMGDVLTGVIAAWLAHTGDVEASARLGVYLHGLAGDLAAAELGERGLIARDVIERLPRACRTLSTT